MSIYWNYPIEAYPRYFESNRMFCDEKFKAFNRNKIICSEIVSFDCSLFEMYEIESPEVALRSDTRQILAVIIRPPFMSAEYLESKGFVFCGYDLVESETSISAITNCGATFNSIPYEKLTEYGLLPTYKDAVLTQMALVEEDPEEPHAYCDICEIWRKIV